MAHDRNKIKELLGTGLSNEIVATATGCDPSYISQLMSEEAFHAEVVGLRMNALTEHNTRDKRLGGLEDAALEKMESLIDYITKPMDAVRALAVINAAKRRGVPAHESLVVNNNIVNLQIPQVVMNSLIINTQGEVVGIGEQTMVPMTAQTLLKQLAESRPDGNKYEKVANHLPTRTFEASSGS